MLLTVMWLTMLVAVEVAQLQMLLLLPMLEQWVQKMTRFGEMQVMQGTPAVMERDLILLQGSLVTQRWQWISVKAQDLVSCLSLSL